MEGGDTVDSETLKLLPSRSSQYWYSCLEWVLNLIAYHWRLLAQCRYGL